MQELESNAFSTINSSLKQDYFLFLTATVSGIFVTGIIISNVFRLIYFRFNLFSRKILFIVCFAVICSYLGALLQLLIVGGLKSLILNGTLFVFNWTNYLFESLALFIIFVFWNAIYLGYVNYYRVKKQELDQLRLLTEKNKMELMTLRGQLNPHFLFNALNSIKALVKQNPDLAQESVTSLSVLLRRSLNAGNADLISLEEELAIVKHYFSLEKVRYEERLDLNYHVDDSILHYRVPPFIIHILAENAIKHGVSKKNSPTNVDLKIYKKNGDLYIQLNNTGVLNSEIKEGVGLSNLRRRLRIQFDKKHTFMVNSNSGIVCSEIRLINFIV